MNGLDLFSGIGGLSIALKPWVRTVAYCERDRYAQAVLLSRMASGELDRAPIWDDVASLNGSMLPAIDIVFGGFPCQDISVAGRGDGLGGERSGLYTHIERLVEETKPTFVFLENVPAIRTRGLGRVVWGLSSLGYDCRWTVVSAASVGAPHKRDRWFLLAYADSKNIREQQGWGSGSDWERETQSGLNGAKESVANACRSGLEGNNWQKPEYSKLTESFGKKWWKVEPDVGRVVDGVPNRVDRIKCLGNAVVPLQAQTAFQILAGIRG